MKKLFAMFLSLVSIFVLSACLGGTGGAEVVVDIPDEFPEEEIEIILWHAFGQANQDLLQEMFDDFEDMYPNVTIRQLGQGGYDDLRSSTVQGTVSGNTPTLVLGYPDHFVEYLQGNALIPLDEYIDHPNHGVDIDMYVPGFLEENQQYVDGNQYSMPFAKSTEMVVYNKTVFDYYGVEFSMDEFITWDDLIALEEEYGLIGDGDYQAPHLFNVDSESNFFINTSSQFGAPYTNAEGEILIDNQDTRDMLNFIKTQIDNDILAIPIEWEENYGSIPFKAGDVLMSQGSTAGTRHNVPDNEGGRFGVFEMGIMPVVQYDEDNPSAIQQGPNIAMMADTTDNERLAAWYLIKHITNPENTAFFAMNTGYVPVRVDAFEDPDYQEFLQIAHTPDEDLTTQEQARKPFSMAANVAYAQVEYYSFEPPFVGRVTSSNARAEVGFMMEAIYAGTRSVEDALQYALRELGQ